MQDHEVGLNPQILTDLPATIESTLAGKATWQAAKQREQELTDDYERKSQQPATTIIAPLPVAKIAPRDEPKRLRLTKLWTATDLKNPGNILLIPDVQEPARQRIFVLDGARTVVELDRQGKTLARHVLEIPQEAAINFLRTATDAKGRRYFAGSASGQQQLFLFDSDWKLLLAFPSADAGKHAGIGDVLLTDLEGKGEPTLAIGYWGQVGVQCVSLDGKRLWNDRSMEYVLRLGTSGSDASGTRQLLCTNSQGSIVPLDAKGKPGSPWILPGIMLDTILAADPDGTGKTALCGLGTNAGETPLAVGIGPHGEDQWNYVMRRGVFTTPIERLTTANFAGKGSPKQWLLAGADGSIHVIGMDGAPLDHFHYGKALTGLSAGAFTGTAGGDDAQTPVLMVATSGGVDAYAVSLNSDIASEPPRDTKAQ